MYPLKGTSVDRVYVVFGARVDLGFFTIRQKRIRSGSTFAERNSGPLKRHLLLARTPIVSVSRMARRYSAAWQTHIRCTLNWTAGGRQAGKDGGWEEGARGGREEAMM